MVTFFPQLLTLKSAFIKEMTRHTVQEPSSRIPCLHVSGDESGWKKRCCVSTLRADLDCVAVERSLKKGQTKKTNKTD